MSGQGGRSRFVRDSASIFGGQVAMTLIGVVTGIITARWLGPHDRGLFQLLTLLPVTLSNFAKLGIPQANVYFMRRRGASPTDVATNSVWLAFVLGAILVAICWFGREWLLTRVLEGTPTGLLLPVLAVVPFTLLQAFFLGVAQAQERFREYNIQQVVPNVLALVGMVVSLVVLKQGLVGAVLVQMAILVFVSGWLAVRVHRRVRLRFAPAPALAGQMMSFGSKSYVQTLAATLHLRIDQYMIAYFLDPTQVGLYAIAVNLTNLLLKIPDATGTVLFPRLAGAEEAEAHRQTMRVCRHTLFLTAAGALAFLVGGPIAIPLLFGDRYRGAIQPLLLLLPAVLMLALYLILSRYFTSRGRQQVNMIAAGVGLALNVGLNWLFIPRLGIGGAACSSFCSYGIAAGILLVAFVRESGHTVKDTIVVQRAELEAMGRAAMRGPRALAGAGGGRGL